MTIDEAIKVLTYMGSANFTGHTEDIFKARQLGIEALERVKFLKGASINQAGFLRPEPLPSETEEGER